ncbi:unnamed protein product [Plutella xylostella]|uniref:(diamondback moth) hypothetical protein n=1 Tax=Plutella xylostella TaxID=51655 RepID=A0A8S4GCG1_PLUXY|nr:unnamed protein product [Plutella xylostella]
MSGQRSEEVAQLDIELLHQRAIEAEEEQKRESRIFASKHIFFFGVSSYKILMHSYEIAEAVEELRGMNTSWSHHRLCDLQRAARWRHSRPSIPDTSRPLRNHASVLKKACSAHLTKPESTQSIADSDGIFINLSRYRRSSRDDALSLAAAPAAAARSWRASTSDVSPSDPPEMQRAPSCPGYATITHTQRLALTFTGGREGGGISGGGRGGPSGGGARGGPIGTGRGFLDL